MESFDEYKQQIKILYVEDNMSAAKKLEKMLSKSYKNIIMAKDGEEALNIYRESFSKKSVDLVITDINMPKMNGIELLEIIREFDDELPFIYVTAKFDTQVLLRLIKLDIVNLLEKPIDIEELQKSINKVITAKYKSNFFRKNHTNEKIAISSELSWNNEMKTINFRNEDIKLTKYEIALIDFLVNNSNKVFTPEVIIENIWDDYYDDGQKSNLKNLISRLKVKLPELNIENVYGLGYKLKVVNVY